MTPTEIRAILGRVARGELALDAAVDELAGRFRTQPYEDLGFARVDHHRATRQGFPEVVLGLGKTPEQAAAVAARLVGKGRWLLVPRADRAMFEAIRAEAPAVEYHEVARAVTLKNGDVTPGHGPVLTPGAGPSDLPVAEEAVVTAEVMGNRVDRLFDVGVAGL